MEITERRILKQVSVLVDQNAINVQWADQILRDGEVIVETLFRKAYAQRQAGEFAIEVEGASDYLSAIGWI